jgi:aspartate racemase
MKTAGIIGGIAPGSTVDYYLSIIKAYREKRADGSYPSILINSIDMKRMLDAIFAKDYGSAVEYIGAQIMKLVQAGADFVLLASNTPHIVFDELSRACPVPMLSIVEASLDEVRKCGLSKVGLFGTSSTMLGGFYQKAFSRAQVEVAAPAPDEIEYVHRKYMEELVNGVFLDGTRNEMASIAKRMQRRDGIQGLILGGTELPLLLRNADDIGMPVFDTSRIHVAKIVKWMLE